MSVPRVKRPILKAPSTDEVHGARWRAIGTSLLGRPILMASFGTGSRRLLYVGGVHGDEYGADIAEQFAAYLADHPQEVPRDTQVDVIGCANPDGRALDRRGNGRNVDINRNFPTPDWSPAPHRGVSGGSAPGSEPETHVLMRALRGKYLEVVSLHSHGGIIDWDGPGGLAAARAVSEACGLPVVRLAPGRQAFYTGTMGEYVPRQYGVPLVTVELTRPWMSPRMRDGLLAPLRTKP